MVPKEEGLYKSSKIDDFGYLTFKREITQDTITI